MKRDDDYIRTLLIEAEASNDPYILALMTLKPSEDKLRRHVHAEWLADAGFFLEVNNGVFRITNQGHDYLAAIRNDTVWAKTKEGAAKVGGVTLNMMKDIAVSYLKKEIAEKTGLDL